MSEKLTRRQIIKLGLATISGSMIATACRLLGVSENPTDTLLPDASPTKAAVPTGIPTNPSETAAASPTVTESPIATQSPPQSENPGPQVVHTHAPNATDWDFSRGFYWQHVNQDVVTQMTNEGLLLLTKQNSIEAVWETLLPDYAPGKIIAIKVNFNNTEDCNSEENIIDGLIEPVNALIAGMKTAGVQETDIWIFDSSRKLPKRFVEGCPYSHVRFFGYECVEQAIFNTDSSDPSGVVRFQHPNIKDRFLTNILIEATYLINMPIVKDHGISGVTLGFKNHYGCIHQVIGGGEDNLHLYINPGEGNYYDPKYNPTVEIYQNPNIHNKTVLVVGDGLFGALENTNVEPKPWQTFGGNAPNSLFFATDPVAIDCVMTDFLDAEPGYHPLRTGADDYLKLAAEVGLGVFERGDPWGSGYKLINYQRHNL